MFTSGIHCFGECDHEICLRYRQLLLQIKQMIFKDMRLHLLSEILSSIKVRIIMQQEIIPLTSEECTHF